MGLSTGSSNYNFTLIVSIFVFGLGFGSLVVRRISHFSESHLFWNQIGVVFSLSLLYLTGDSWPYWVHLLRIMFRDIPESFYFYQAALGIGFLILMIVPVGLCGLTLPLCFHLLKDRQETLGQRVGQLYGLNTVGCVMGALVGGYTLLSFLNLDQIFKVCVFLGLMTVPLAGYLYSLRFKTIGPANLRWKLRFLDFLVGIFIAPLVRKGAFHPAVPRSIADKRLIFVAPKPLPGRSRQPLPIWTTRTGATHRLESVLQPSTVPRNPARYS